MDPYLVLVVADSLDLAADSKARIDAVLPDAEVLVTRAAEVSRSVAALRPDVVVTDTDDLVLHTTVRDAQAGTPVLVIGSVPDGELAASIERLADEYRVATADSRRQVVLAIGAHPDDAEMGVGGILAAHRAAGDKVTVLTLSMGHRPGGPEVALREGEAAAAVIGARLVAHPEVELLVDLEPLIASVVEELRPTIVYTHSATDRREEHRLVNAATIAVTGEINTVACYHGTTGSPEFNPTEFVTIDDQIDTKLAMLASFAIGDDRPPYLEPGFVLSTARYWSQYGLGAHVEPLEVVRRSALSPISR